MTVCGPPVVPCNWYTDAGRAALAAVLACTGLLFFTLPGLPSVQEDSAGCNGKVAGIECKFRCVRSLGSACLVAEIGFSANVKAGTRASIARFQTCRYADVDLLLKSIRMPPGGADSLKFSPIVSVASSDTEMHVEAGRTDPGENRDRIAFPGFLNSGSGSIEVAVSADKCGASGRHATCSMSGVLVAVTNPNIRCEFGGKSSPGTFIEQPAMMNTGPVIQR